LRRRRRNGRGEVDGLVRSSRLRRSGLRRTITESGDVRLRLWMVG
jgi:hypothetical protein